jgi:ATP-dependent Clp protease ATP-binding subunit ClpC
MTRTVADVAQHEKDTLMKAMRKKFAPEFLNRIDEIIIFNRLQGSDVERILDLELAQLGSNLKEIGNYGLRVNKVAKEVIIAEGYSEAYGARQLNRAIESLIENRISEMVLKNELREGGVINVKARDGKLIITASNK